LYHTKLKRCALFVTILFANAHDAIDDARNKDKSTGKEDCHAKTQQQQHYCRTAIIQIHKNTTTVQQLQQLQPPPLLLFDFHGKLQHSPHFGAVVH